VIDCESGEKVKETAAAAAAAAPPPPPLHTATNVTGLFFGIFTTLDQVPPKQTLGNCFSSFFNKPRYPLCRPLRPNKVIDNILPCGAPIS